jgi:carboxymethylenebutenolidase
MGGRVAYLANASQPFAACISYYGSNIHSMSDLAQSLSGPHLFFWGGKDKHILPEHVMTVEEFMRESGKPYINVVISYADHAFNSDERPNYNPKAASEAWAMSMAFLRNNLKS